MRRFTLLVFMTFFVGCATAPYHPTSVDRYKQMLSTWDMKDVNDLIYAWGPPTSTFTMPNGNKMFTWANIKVGPTVTTTTGSSFGQAYRDQFLGHAFSSGFSNSVSITQTWDCYTTAITNSSGMITSWQLKGNDCFIVYTDDELAKKMDTLDSIAATLKGRDRIQLTFFDGATDEDGVLYGKNLVGYFSNYNQGTRVIYMTPKIETGFFQAAPDGFPLKKIENIAVLEQVTKKP